MGVVECGTVSIVTEQLEEREGGVVLQVASGASGVGKGGDRELHLSVV